MSSSLDYEMETYADGTEQLRMRTTRTRTRTIRKMRMTMKKLTMNWQSLLRMIMM
jgi:hypothetical protein